MKRDSNGRFVKGTEPPKSAFKKGHPTWNKGIYVRLNPNNEFKKGIHTNEKHPRWKGENASYSAIHHWVKQHKGKPKVCEMCGEKVKRIEWCNIDHLYKRILDDYISLCRSCHRKFDYTYNLKPDNKMGNNQYTPVIERRAKV